ncbi:MAG TPA: hypothetical protein VK913_01755 [Erythrobacter sp.]|nr:hypothetical protein [Erythrobacter sp.]
MKSPPHTQPRSWPLLPWLTVALGGVAAPGIALLVLADKIAPAPLASVAGPIVAVGLMGAGMIAAAAAGRLWLGVLIALLTGAGLILFAIALGVPALPYPLSTAFAVIIAALSFAARGALFARSAADKGWWVAVAVVAGEAAVLFTASTMPDALPDWLLALLPAQWASAAIQTSLTGSGTLAASSELFALAGTAAATLLVARLWPRRWPYLIMCSVWLGLSALVWHWPAAAMPHAGNVNAATQAITLAPWAGSSRHRSLWTPAWPG